MNSYSLKTLQRRTTNNSLSSEWFLSSGSHFAVFTLALCSNSETPINPVTSLFDGVMWFDTAADKPGWVCTLQFPGVLPRKPDIFIASPTPTLKKDQTYSLCLAVNCRTKAISARQTHTPEGKLLYRWRGGKNCVLITLCYFFFQRSLKLKSITFQMVSTSEICRSYKSMQQHFGSMDTC